MNEYLVTVTWEINIYADSPKEAAAIALDIQRSDSTATVFTVQNIGCAKEERIDLSEEEEVEL